MCCICRAVEGNWAFWSGQLQNAFTLNQVPGLINLFPAEDEEGWNVRNVYEGEELNAALEDNEGIDHPRQWRVIARHIYQDIPYEKLKLAATALAGVALTAAAVAAMVATAVGTLIVAIEILIGFYEMMFGLPVVLSALTAAEQCAYWGALVVYVVVVELAWANIFAATATAVGAIWTKVVVPNISRGSAYITHLTDTARRLEYMAGADAIYGPDQQEGEAQDVLV